MQNPQTATRTFLLLSAVYFLWFALQRSLLGGVMEVDESEMLLLARHWAWGYGPQFPLYNWLQVATFQTFGVSTTTFAFTKAVVLWLGFAGMWMAMGRAFPQGRAGLAAGLVFFFMPNVVWEFQRASTHSVALLATMSWTLFALFGVMARGQRRDFVLLGVMIGLGGLSKANYWFFLASLLVASALLWRRGDAGWPRLRPGLGNSLIAAGIAALMLAVPYGWAVMHPAKSLASLHKFYDPTVAEPTFARVTGNLGLLVLGGLVIAALVAVGIAALDRPMVRRGWLWPARMMLWAGLMQLAVAVGLVIAFRVTDLQTRWFVPAFILISAAAFAQVGRDLGSRGARALVALSVCFALLTTFGMYRIRTAPTGAGQSDFSQLLSVVRDQKPDRIEGGFFWAGNLALLHPEMDIVQEGTSADRGERPGRLLLLGAVAQDQAPPGYTATARGTVQACPHGGPAARCQLDWVLEEAPL